MYDQSNPDWAPTQNMGHQSAEVRNVTEHRYNRLKDRKRKIATNEAAVALLHMHQNPPPIEQPGIACQTDNTGLYIDELNTKCNALLKENADLKKRIAQQEEELSSLRVTEAELMADESKLCFFTGIGEWITFAGLLSLITPNLPNSGHCKLDPFQQFLLFCMKIRLNLCNQDLAYRHGISVGSVSRIFHRVLDVVHAKISPLIHWPTRPTLRQSMPTSFRRFFNKCAIIIDCTEIFIEQPSDLLARAQTWSSYKHHNTVKFLIGITPQGTVSFLSHCWGGRASDKIITESSSLLNMLEPGDVVIADRGFTIDDYCSLALSEVKIPPFTRGKKQLDKCEVDWSRELSIVRIHVERVIGAVKQKYTILGGTLPISLVGNFGDGNNTMDKLVNVCCALYNCCPSVVPLD